MSMHQPIADVDRLPPPTDSRRSVNVSRNTRDQCTIVMSITVNIGKQMIATFIGDYDMVSEILTDQSVCLHLVCCVTEHFILQGEVAALVR